MVRLFVAVMVPEEYEEALQSLCKDISIKGVKCTSHFHCTLKFLGEVDDKKVNEIKKRLNEIKFEKFEANFSGIGAFSNESYMKVIWIGLKPEEKFKELANIIDDSLKNIFEKNKRFRSHVTLGRVKFIFDKKELKEKFEQLKKREIEGKFIVNNFCLVKSMLNKNGPVYTVVKEFKSQ